MLTENDLRTSLLEFAGDTEIDERAVRDRIEQRLTMPARPRRNRLTLVAAVAACAAVAVGIAFGVHAVQHRDKNQPGTHSPTSHSTTPSDIRYPGTVKLTQFSGTGSKTIDISAWPVPHGLVYAFTYTCQGPGTFEVSGLIFNPGCDPHAIQGASAPDSSQSLHVKTGPSTTWRLTLLAEPPSRTNAMIISPPDPGPGGWGTGAGHGDGTVTLNHAASAGSYRIWLTCNGSGVTISSSSKAVRNDYTKSCFVGFSYTWDVPKGTAPTTLNVSASADTTWTLTVTPN